MKQKKFKEFDLVSFPGIIHKREYGYFLEDIDDKKCLIIDLTSQQRVIVIAKVFLHLEKDKRDG